MQDLLKFGLLLFLLTVILSSCSSGIRGTKATKIYCYPKDTCDEIFIGFIIYKNRAEVLRQIIQESGCVPEKYKDNIYIK